MAPRQTRELSKTTLVRRSRDPVPLPPDPSPLDRGRVSLGAGRPSLDDLLAAGDHDGFLVLYRGRVVDQSTTLGFDPRLDTHAMNSASKVVVACIAGRLAAEGSIDLHAPIERYVREAASTAYQDISLQLALDMQTGVDLDPFDEFLALGVHPQQGDREAIGIYRLAMTRRQRVDGGRPGTYRPTSTDTDMVAMACERAAGRPFSRLVGDLWEAIGAEENADLLVDDYQTPIFNGGLAPTLHDLGRLGHMLASGGRVRGRQVVPADFLEDSLRPTLALREAFQSDFYGSFWPGVVYHNTFFLDPRRPGVSVNYGAFGNLLVVDRPRHMVGVLLSAWAKPNEGVMDWIDAFAAIGDALEKRR